MARIIGVVNNEINNGFYVGNNNVINSFASFYDKKKPRHVQAELSLV